MKIGIDVDEWWPYFFLVKPEDGPWVIDATEAEIKHWTKTLEDFSEMVSIINERTDFR